MKTKKKVRNNKNEEGHYDSKKIKKITIIRT